MIPWGVWFWFSLDERPPCWWVNHTAVSQSHDVQVKVVGGFWKTLLPPQKAGGDWSVSASSGKDTIDPWRKFLGIFLEDFGHTFWEISWVVWK